MDKIKYKDVEYPIRNIFLEDIDQEVTISIEELNDVLIGANGDYDSHEARIIDETIYFFVERNEMLLSDSKLEKLLTKIVI